MRGAHPAPGRASRKNEGTGDTSTGFIKNFAHIQEPWEEQQERFLTTYKRVNNEREERTQTSGGRGGGGGGRETPPGGGKWGGGGVHAARTGDTHATLLRRPRQALH